MQKILNEINAANDVRKVDPKDLDLLAQEIRKFLLKNVSRTGGHLSSNLGAVELTIALHRCLEFPEDKLIFDVGHQSYTHKILTGRKNDFPTLRSLNGMSGFPKTDESDADCFNTGHSSTSISAALGFAKARDMEGKEYKVCAVIGDGALTGGMAFEALNNAARLKSNMVIVLNDNNMSISKNVGGMANYLGKVRTAVSYTDLKGKVEAAVKRVPKFGDKLTDKIRSSKDSIKRLVIPGMLFEDMGITYIGPIDGHDIELLIRAFNTAFAARKPVLVHVITKKGKGYRLAEENSSKFHGIEPFIPYNGELKKLPERPGYTDIFANELIELADKDERIVAITAAMQTGTGLDKFEEKHKDRLIDVGIAEEHAVTFAAGMASAGMRPVVCIYSTFLQRAYDQILHDVCLNSLPVVFAIDRAGIVGKDGATHQGIFDISYLSSMPNMTVAAPANDKELIEMIELAFNMERPFAIRYPRGEARTLNESLGIAGRDAGTDVNGATDSNSAAECKGAAAARFDQTEVEYGKALLRHERSSAEKGVAIGYIGSMEETAYKLYDMLLSDGIEADLVNFRFVRPLDKQMLDRIAERNNVIAVLEENVFTGGLGEQTGAYLSKCHPGCRLIAASIRDTFVEHGDREELLKMYGLDPEQIYKDIRSALTRAGD